MTDATNAEFSPEEVSDQAQGTATALALTALAYLKERGLDLDEYVAFHGRRFAPGEFFGQGGEYFVPDQVKSLAGIVTGLLVPLGQQYFESDSAGSDDGSYP